MVAAPQFSDHPEHFKAIREAALRAANPYRAVRSSIHLDGATLHIGESRYELVQTGRVFVAGAGKAGAAMAHALADTLGSRLTAGVVAVPRLSEDERHPVSESDPVSLIHAGHPIPDEGSLEAGRKIRDLLAQTRPDDLVLAPISGGGSALLELPQPGLTLAELRATNDVLLQSGATVQEINVVRQRLSQIKGGGLARMAYPASVVGLILSDIVGDPLHLIASGPTVTPLPLEDSLAIVERYGLARHLPPAVLAHLRSPPSAIRDTCTATHAPPRHLRPGQVWPPKRSEEVGVRCKCKRSANRNLLVGSNALSLEAASEAAHGLGFSTAIQPESLIGEARDAGKRIGEQIKRVRTEGGPVCLIWGGETTVAVRGRGKGGRNQEVALASAIALRGVDRVAVMTLGTDGIDGPTDAAGAIVTGEAVLRGEALGLSAETALSNNDTYPYLQALDALVITGTTGTNVNDLTVALVY